MEAQNKVYFNAPQRLTQLIGANTTVIVAGRRTGKTDSIASPFVLRNMQRMPGLYRRHRRPHFQTRAHEHFARVIRRMEAVGIRRRHPLCRGASSPEMVREADYRAG